MREKGLSAKEVLRRLLEHYREDAHFSSGRVLGSMCTEPLPIARAAHMLFIEANLGNPGLYPGTVKMEREVIESLGNLMGLEEPKGYILSGGTEANITALYLAKKRNGGRYVVYPRSAHFSINKGIKLLDLKPLPVDLTEDYVMDVDHLRRRIREVGEGAITSVVAVAGSTEFGTVDPVEEISEVIPEGVPLHVDAAFGGFVLPFLNFPRKYNFEVEGVSSITVDPHKMGLSTIPSGALLLRSIEGFKRIAVSSPYLTEPMAYTLAGTRASAAVAATWAVMNFMGREGYREVVEECMRNTRYLDKELTKLGFPHVVEPTINVLASLADDPESLQKRLEEMRWYVSKVCRPPALRFVLMPHVKRSHLMEFLRDFRGLIQL
ncbi:MAG: tyrosine decarboxylase MfnA [Thermoplasmata archaeon]|nr:tyrosine decarboxylase MfnA [Thermoplasmata archaeon]